MTMRTPTLALSFMLASGPIWVSNGGPTGAALRSQRTDESEVNVIRQVEKQRLQALVAGDMAFARTVRAEDFQLVTPGATVFTKEGYLGQVERGELDYLVWEPKEIAVRLSGDAAVIRYESYTELVRRAKGQPDVRVQGVHWHTDLYEKRNGKWQVVWSHASRVRQ
jgi:hypothetical protein